MSAKVIRTKMTIKPVSQATALNLMLVQLNRKVGKAANRVERLARANTARLTGKPSL